jgi:hypothetical protein
MCEKKKTNTPVCYPLPEPLRPELGGGKFEINEASFDDFVEFCDNGGSKSEHSSREVVFPYPLTK